MAPSPSSSDIVPQDLARQILDLRTRLEAVELKLGLENARLAPEAGVLTPPSLAPPPLPGVGDTAAVTTLIGKSLLGLALAYLLRALTENGTLPVAAGVAAGLAYALAWLFWAARTPAAETVPVAVRSLTSVLIMAPLLWESLLRFQATTSWQTAGILVLFTAFGLGISWRKNLTPVALISTVAGLLLCSALLIRTHDLLPYTCALLGLAVLVEISACLEHYLGERWIVAAIADLAVLLTTFVATRPPGSLEGYAPLQRGEVLFVQIALVLVYLASTFVRTLGRGFNIAPFEIAQCIVAAVLGSWGALAVAQGHPTAVLAAGSFWALCGVACYVVSFFFLERHAGKDRNFLTYATFGLALVLAGTSLLLKGPSLVGLWSLLAVFFVLAGQGSGRMTLKVHAGVYIVLASLASGLGSLAAGLFFSSEAHPDSLTAGTSAWIAAAGALVSYALFARAPLPSSMSSLGAILHRVASVLLAGAALWSLAGIAAVAAGPLCRAMSAGPGARDFCPTLLTFILVGLAVFAAVGASRLQRIELKWFAWILTFIASYKLVLQDFRQAHTFAMVVSLLLYGGALIWLPRLLRRGRSASSGLPA